ncbi:intraflagellar transport protein 140, partial [Paragonimus westermani]
LFTRVVSLFTSADQAHPVVLEHFPMGFQHGALLGLEVPYYYFSVRSPSFFYHIKCDLVYRLVNEQCQRRRDLATNSRRLVSDSTIDDGLNIPDLTGTCAEPHPSGDKSIDCATQKKRSDGPLSVGSSSSSSVKIHYINRRVLRDFIDLERADGSTREAMLSFSYYLTMGEMDAAFKAMKFIKSPAVWQNMARMCVNTCRLDVARLCLGKMGNPMAALMVREARSREPEAEAHAGELAIQLGMPNEAERLFTQCGRWDLVIRLHQSLGQWDKALRVATSHNRIALRATHYAYAKELESMGKVEQAIEQSIYRWWAQTLEAQGKLDEARTYYVQAKDYLSLVRVLCCLGRNEDAETLCNETGDPAACYHLARQMEANGGIEQAIRLFTRAKAYSSAVRLCKEHNRNDHLYSLAQLGRVEDMLEAATHLESVPAYANKAVLLFHKAGHSGRAVELAFQTRQYAALQTVASSLDDKIDPTLLRRCAEFFTQNNQFDRAVDVLAAGKQYWDALKLCAEYNVRITDGLVDKLTPPPSGTLSDSERTGILIELGELCMSQGQYHLACKQFTQAGSRIAAMKALLRSGDTSKIIFFANVSKQKEIYVMAANYLQTLNDWRSNTDYMRTIVQFYTRGRAPESLASFYEACAHAEIEELGSYEKATGALTEAYKVLLKAINSTTTNESTELRLQKRLTQIKTKATMCKEFAETQALFSVDPLEAMRNCQALLENNEPGDILRPGDIYAAMIREFVSKGKYQPALACMQEMRERLNCTNQSVLQYIDRNTLETIHRAIDVPMPEEAKAPGSKPNGNEIIGPTESPVSEDDILDASASNGSDDSY